MRSTRCAWPSPATSATPGCSTSAAPSTTACARSGDVSMPADDRLQITLTRGEAQLLLDYATLGAYYANAPGARAVLKPEEQLRNIRQAKDYQAGFTQIMQRVAE